MNVIEIFYINAFQTVPNFLYLKGYIDKYKLSNIMHERI